MKKLILMISLVLFFQGCVSSSGLSLTDNGVAKYKIVVSSRATQAEVYSAEELKKYLDQATNTKFEIVNEKTNVMGPAIYVGPSYLAERNNLKQSEFSSEEWVIKNIGQDIIITGGRPRGVLYGVYEFLERFAGCRWYDIYTERVPKTEQFVVPVPLEIRGKPAFIFRSVKFPVKGWPYEAVMKFAARNRMNGYLPAMPQLGYSEVAGSPGGAHTYLKYSEGMPLEYYSMHEDGKRVKVTKTTQGQICYSNPNVRKVFAERLRKYIQDDRKKAKESGIPYPIFYDVSANDCSAVCHCDDCRELAEKYGVSGMVVDFTNAIAADIEKEYPDVLVTMFAYKEAEAPPKNIMARDNVMVRLACLDLEFTGRRDVMRPLDSSYNQDYVTKMDGWHKAAKHLAIWDYWKLYYEQFASPKTCISSRAEYMKKYRDLGALSIYIEAEVDPEPFDSFIDLRNYVGARLMLNPDVDMKLLIDDYMDGFYGAGAVPMKKYLDYLESRMAEEKLPLSYVNPAKRVFLDEAFFINVDKFITEAEALAGNQPRQLENIKQERLIVDIAYLNMFDKFSTNLLKLDKKALMARVFANWDAYGKKYHTAGYWGKKRQQLFEGFKSKIMDRPVLPKQFEGKNLIDMIAVDFNFESLAVDEDAAGGKAVFVPQKRYRFEEPFHGRDLAFGIYSRTQKKRLLEKTISKKDLSQDEKYHFYYLGQTPILENSVLWVHWSWGFQGFLKNAYDPLNPDVLYDVYVSIKVQGPSYVNGSQKADDVRIDRAIFVKVLSPACK